MTHQKDVSSTEPDPTTLYWIIRSPDGEHVLKDEDFNAVMMFSNEKLASEFATKEVGEGNFKTEERLWLTLALQLSEDGFDGAVIDFARGDEYKNLALFGRKGSSH